MRGDKKRGTICKELAHLDNWWQRICRGTVECEVDAIVLKHGNNMEN